MPAPVHSIEVSSSVDSARVTWSIPTEPKNSSYITQVIIYQNGSQGSEYQSISRTTQARIDSLKPNTEYTVGIETRDGSAQKSQIIYKSFKTKEAGKRTWKEYHSS